MMSGVRKDILAYINAGTATHTNLAEFLKACKDAEMAIDEKKGKAPSVICDASKTTSAMAVSDTPTIADLQAQIMAIQLGQQNGAQAIQGTPSAAGYGAAAAPPMGGGYASAAGYGATAAPPLRHPHGSCQLPHTCRPAQLRHAGATLRRTPARTRRQHGS